MEYEEYLKSDQKKDEDRIYLEFSRKHNLGVNDDHLNVARGILNAFVITIIIGVFIWLTFF